MFQGRYFGRIFGHRCVRTSFRIQKDQKKQKDHAGDDIVNVVEKKRLSQEAGLQMKALAQISQWKMTALFVSALGAAFTYAGFAGVQRNLFLGIPGILLILAGFGSAAVFNLGIKNGRRNVEKMLNILDGEV